MSKANRVDPRRVRLLKEGTWGTGPVIYWMSREQRATDNWALLHAQDLAEEWERPLGVAFCLTPTFLGAGERQYDFMLRGLEELAPVLKDKGIRFQLLLGAPG